MSYDFCGLDFGTSNSTIGIFDGQNIKMVPLEQGKPILRSAIFFDYDAHKCIFGQQGISQYLDAGHGRLMMSLKSVLGSNLMKEKTFIDNKWVSYTDILEHLLRYIKTQAEQEAGHALTQVVLGRPVRFHDHDDKKDRLAEETLEKVAHQVGFKTVLFQFEPIAAALAYEQTIDREQLALIVDLGGGTADFSVIRLRPQSASQVVGSNTQVASKHTGPSKNSLDRQKDVLSNKGIHIGGTDFDTRFSLELVMPHMGLGGRMHGMSSTIEIPSSYYHDLTTWHTINGLYTHQTHRALESIHNHALEPAPIRRLIKVIQKQQGHRILSEVERAKCLLSSTELAILNFNFIESHFEINALKIQFEAAILEKVERLIQTLQTTVTDAGLENEAIDSLFFTGGSAQIPIIRQKIMERFPNARIVQGDVFSSVGKGLILDAKQRFNA